MSKKKKRKNKKNWRKQMTSRLFDRYTLDTVVNEQENEPVDEIGFDSDSWDNTSDDLKVVSACGRIPSGPMTIILSRLVKAKIDILMKKYTNCEWLAYLLGDEDTRYARDLFVPTQTATSGAVTFVGTKPAGVIGVIHSHHHMGAFFSGTDDAYINQNNDISIVIAHKGIKAQVRWVTPCGYKVVCEGKVIVESENLINEDEFINQVEKVINHTSNTINFKSNEPFDPVKAQLLHKQVIFPPKYTKGIRGLSGNAAALLETCENENERDEIKELLTNRFRKN